MSQGTIAALLAVTGLAAMAAAWWAFAFRRLSGDHDAAPITRRIRVHEGYEPDEVHVPAGRPARLVFFRDETVPCSERIVFPDFGLSVGLPPFQEIAVDLPAGAPGEHPFTCEMEMLHGRLVVDEAPVTATAGAAR